MNNTKTSREDLRVLQKNMIYCSGLPSNITHAELISDSYFGLYGKVQKLVRNPFPNRNYCSVYITYSHEFQAATAILACNEYQIDRSTLWCLFGTMKYCKFFLKKIQCKNIPNCPYLHIFDHKNQIQIQASPSEAYPEHEELAKKVLLKHEKLRQKMKQERKTGGQFPDPVYALQAIGEYQSQEEQDQISAVNKQKQKNGKQGKNDENQELSQQSGNSIQQEKQQQSTQQSEQKKRVLSLDSKIKKMILRQLEKANGSRIMKDIVKVQGNLRQVMIDGLKQ